MTRGILTLATVEASRGLHVDGEDRTASDGRHFVVEDPATGRPLARVADASADDAVVAVEAAARAFRTWRREPPRVRAEILRRAFEMIGARRGELAELIVRENGKVLGDALAEVDYAAEFFRWFSEEAVRIDGEARIAPSGANRILVLRQPVGVAALVTPWNFPAAMAARKIAPALAAGCTVVLKPAPETPLTALALSGLLEEAGAPPGVVNVVPSARAAEVVGAMTAHDDVRKLSFTGSTEVGRFLLHAAADRVLDVSMELGGNAAFVVFADADAEDAVAGAVLAKMRNGGQACTAANRIYVEEPIAPEFARRLADALGGLRLGPGLDPSTDVGPLVSEEARDKVADLVDDAVARGARALVGGRAPERPGWFYAPTVLVDVDPSSRLLREEIFGPVAPIVPFRGLDEALALANDTEYGLASYVYTRDLARGLAFAEGVETGIVGVNKGLVSDPAAPFGGMKQSGLGREGAHDGLLAFTESKYVALDWGADG